MRNNYTFFMEVSHANRSTIASLFSVCAVGDCGCRLLNGNENTAKAG
jgi:hypothetical protein